jgi:hypothetical protein
MDFKQLSTILESGSHQELEDFCKQNDLIIKDGKIFHKNPDEIKKQVEYWDKRQLVKKINLNS